MNDLVNINTAEEQHKPATFPIAAIGASAGGLEAITELLENLPEKTGIAFVIIQHLSPNHTSILPELLQRKTTMPVHEAANETKILPDNVYVIPPHSFLSVADGTLVLSVRTTSDISFHAIDYFFLALAKTYQALAIGIVLSGALTDGTEGLKEIKAEGGITFAQDETAQFQGMPGSAIDAGVVDFILTPKRIAQELTAIMKLPYVALSPEEIAKENEQELRKIQKLLHSKRGIDFMLYKQTTIQRRILRRMTLNRLTMLEDYTQLLRNNPDELSQLYQDLLINVTRFFRDGAAYQALSKKIFPALVKDRKALDPIRIWVPACSTGEEACSIAICLFEFLGNKGLATPFQIFATDLNEAVIEKARSGIYSKTLVENVSPQRLRRFFIKTDGHYQVVKAIRDVCVFAAHNLLSDPPFSRMDLVSCQNVMIYLEPNPQNKILQAFHYALKPTGFLLLGKSESIGNATDLFEQADKNLKIYTKKETRGAVHFDFSMRSTSGFAVENDKIKSAGNEKNTASDIEKEADRILLSRYLPASVLINNDLNIIRFHGAIAGYLQPAGGKASLHLLKMVRDELVFDLRTLLHRAKKEGQLARKEGILYSLEGQARQLTLEVVPVKSAARDLHFLVLFKEGELLTARQPAKAVGRKTRHDVKDSYILSLEQELREAREHMKTMSEEFEATREELQSANEEVLSSNEELQSINEELETSKEELQSSNEELTTINEELQHRNDDLKEAFEYREAIVETIREPLVVLNSNQRIKSANKAFYNHFKLIPAETEGYLFSEIANGQWNIPSLKKQLNENILKNKGFQNFEVTHVFPLLGERIISFNALRMGVDQQKKNNILLVLEDITESRKAEENLVASHNLNLSILNSISDLFISVDNNWILTFMNKQAEQLVGRTAKQVLGKHFWEVMADYVGTDFYTQLMMAMKTKKQCEFEFYVESAHEWFHYRIYPSDETLSVYANRITEQKQSLEIIKQSKERYESFITKTTEGIWRFELREPVGLNEPKAKQVDTLYNQAYVAECNDAMAKMYGFDKAEQLAGKGLKDVLNRSEKNEALIKAFVENDYRVPDAYINETDKEGNVQYALINLVGIVEQDKIVRIWGSRRDITAQKKAELDLFATQHKLNLSLSAGTVGIWTYYINTGTIEWSKEMLHLYCVKQQDFTGTLEFWKSKIFPDDLDFFTAALQDAIKQRHEYNIEYRIVCSNNEVRWMLSKAGTSYDNNNQPQQITGVNIDITERKQREQINRENEERFYLLVQNAFEMINIFSPDGTIHYQSDSIARVLGYQASEITGKNIFDPLLVHPSDIKIEKYAVQQAIDHPGKNITAEFRLMHKDGNHRIIEAAFINLIINPRIKGIVANYRDITDRKNLEKQKDEFISIASHELKTPVTSIKAFTQILEQSFSEINDTVTVGMLRKMDKQVDRLTNLIKDLLDVTKITEGQLKYNHEEININDLVNEVVDEMQMTTKKHNLQKQLQPIGIIVGDRERIAQVLVNLLSNAIKYSPNSDSIIIKGGIENDYVKLGVQDFGIGIRQDVQEKLFNRFFRASDALASTYPGLGLGLFISAEIIKNQQGTIWVESEYGKGSTFYFTLPLNR